MESGVKAVSVSALLFELEAAVHDFIDWMSEWHCRLVGAAVRPDSDNASQRLVAVAMQCRELDLDEPSTFDELASLERDMARQSRALSVKAAQAAVRSDGYARLMEAAERFLALAQRLVARLRGASTDYDMRTGLATRAAMFRELKREHARVARLGRPSTLALVVIGGEQAQAVGSGRGADEPLTRVSRSLVDNLRPYDAVYRYDEATLAVCLPDTVVESARSILERIRACVETNGTSGSSGGIACVLGVAPIEADTNIEVSLNRAFIDLDHAVALGQAGASAKEGGGGAGD